MWFELDRLGGPVRSRPMNTVDRSPQPLRQLTEGMPIVVGGDRVVRVTAELAAAFVEGDRLLTVPATGALLHVPASVGQVTERAVDRAATAFARMGAVSDEAVTTFFETFADRLADDATFAPIAEANAADVAAAKARGRTTTRLVLSDVMRADMIDGLRTWAKAPSGRDEVVDRVDHDGWAVELRRAGLGVVGFVFEGRPNVFADACGVIRSGNTVVFRIGSDALGSAAAIVAHALDPALAAAGLPEGSATLVAAAERSAGYALFADPRLALAVARGSGAAVAQLGAVAQGAGVPVSLHGTGGRCAHGIGHGDTLASTSPVEQAWSPRSESLATKNWRWRSPSLSDGKLRGRRTAGGGASAADRRVALGNPGAQREHRIAGEHAAASEQSALFPVGQAQLGAVERILAVDPAGEAVADERRIEALVGGLGLDRVLGDDRHHKVG